MRSNRMLLLLVVGIVVAGAGVVGWSGDDAEAGAFWKATALAELNGAAGPEFEDVDALVRASDAVIIGRLKSISPGRVFGTRNPKLPDPRDSQIFLANAKVEVEEVLHGNLDLGWSLEVLVSSPDDIAELQPHLRTAERSIFFLVSTERENRRLGLNDTRIQAAKRKYSLTTIDSVLVDHHGQAESPLAVDHGEAFRSIGGKSLNTVAAEIRAR